MESMESTWTLPHALIEYSVIIEILLKTNIELICEIISLLDILTIVSVMLPNCSIIYVKNLKIRQKLDVMGS